MKIKRTWPRACARRLPSAGRTSGRLGSFWPAARRGCESKSSPGVDYDEALFAGATRSARRWAPADGHAAASGNPGARSRRRHFG